MRKLPVVPLEVMRVRQQYIVGVVMLLPAFAEAGVFVDWPQLVNYN